MLALFHVNFELIAQPPLGEKQLENDSSISISREWISWASSLEGVESARIMEVFSSLITRLWEKTLTTLVERIDQAPRHEMMNHLVIQV